MRTNNNRRVYSTDPEENARLKEKTKPASVGRSAASTKQTVKVMRSRKGRGGKTVTLVSGLQHCPDALEKLARRLKQVCGCGGSVKGGEILIQGDHRDKVAAELHARGYTVNLSGGDEKSIISSG